MLFWCFIGVQKPFSDNALVDRIEQALQVSAERMEVLHDRHDIVARINELTDREQEVMYCIARGLANKATADELGISVRTVEVHRARVFDKMRVKSADNVNFIFEVLLNPSEEINGRSVRKGRPRDVHAVRGQDK